MRVLHVVGARPNFIKIAPLMREMNRYPDDFEQLLVHTGQHYDPAMSDIFFSELEIPRPDVNLDVGSGSHAMQTGEVMLRFEPVLEGYLPDWVNVVGDVNSTLACSLTATKMGIPVSHVEAGLRSFDRSMPEEINRMLTDQIADLLFTPAEGADENLKREGIDPEKIHFVGNIMIDTLVSLMPKAELRWNQLKNRFPERGFILVTLHRPANVDDLLVLHEILAALAEIGRKSEVIFPVHPRTRQQIKVHGFDDLVDAIQIVEPVGYLDFLALQSHASLVLTDSGGVQEETTYLGIPCLTVRPNTERPVTISMGTNQLVGNSRESLIQAITSRLKEGKNARQIPPLWDGRTAERIVQVFQSLQE